MTLSLVSKTGGWSAILFTAVNGRRGRSSLCVLAYAHTALVHCEFAHPRSGQE